MVARCDRFAPRHFVKPTKRISMAKKEPKVEQPTDAQQREYLSLRDNNPTIVHIDGSKKEYKVRWLRNSQLEKLSRLLVHKKDNDNEDSESIDVLDEIVDDAKLACKTAAIYLLDGFFKLKFYWFLWRWFYYVKEYSAIQLMEILDVGKKKIPLTQFFLLTMSLTEARGTLMMMTTREAERILQEQRMERSSSTASNSSGSSSQDTTSSD